MTETKKKSNLVIILLVLGVIGVVGFCFIGLLAAIAVPNFLEAQVRAKVARSRADLRTVTTAVESYKIDAKAYPVNPKFDGDYTWLTNLNRPIEYLTSDEVYDPFHNPQERIRYYQFRQDGSYPSDFPLYILYTSGPDGDYETQVQPNGRLQGIRTLQDFDILQYDPSNGTISNGDIIRQMFSE